MKDRKPQWLKLIWLAPLGLAALCGIAYAAMMLTPAPDGLDLSLSKASAAGHYITTLTPGIEPVTVGPMHTWTVTLKGSDAAPVENAHITVDGGMPQHGHGLPTQPQVTAYLGDGRYLVEGMKFNMPGWWTLTVHIDAGDGDDETTFNFVL